MLTPEQNDAIFGPSIRVFRINRGLLPRSEFDIIRTTSPFQLDKPRFYLPNPVKARFFSFTPRDVVFVVQASE